MSSEQVVEEIWVDVAEGAKKTGYSAFHIRKLARDNWSKPENERLIRLRRLTMGYIIWLPDLVKYAEEYGYGPYPKREKHK